jgi:hypothetical protein
VAIELILSRVNGEEAFVERKVMRGKSGIRNPKQITQSSGAATKEGEKTKSWRTKLWGGGEAGAGNFNRG